MATTRTSPIVAVTIGALAGLASGLVGIGGGTVMIPLLVMWGGLAQHRAHATSLAAIAPIGLVGGLVFAAEGEVDLALAALLVAGGLLGAPLGARIMAGLPERGLKIAFGLLMVAIGSVLVLR